MVRKNENKKKLKSKPAKTTRARKGKSTATHVSTEIVSTSASEHDYTLPEGNYFDSFDIISRDEKRELKKKQALKKDVRASFNRDSSIDVDTDISNASESQVSTLSDVVDVSECSVGRQSQKIVTEKSIHTDNTFKFNNSERRRFHKRKSEKQAAMKAANRAKNPAKEPVFGELGKNYTAKRERELKLRARVQRNSTPLKDSFRELSSIPFDESADVPECIAVSNKSASTPGPSKVLMNRRRRLVNNQQNEPNNTCAAHSGTQTPTHVVHQTAADISHVSSKINMSALDGQSLEGIDTSNFNIEHSYSADNELSAIDLSVMSCGASIKSADESIAVSQQRNEKTEATHHSSTDDSVVHITSHETSKQTVEVISVSSASQHHTSTVSTLSTSSPSMASSAQPKLSVKNRVGFDDSDVVFELSKVTKPCPKIMIKGGKWRRTIFELRKNKTTQSPKRMSENKENQHGRKSNRQSHANVMRRKSIFIKNIPDRKTRDSQAPRNSHKIVTVLNDFDESICSTDFSPKPTPINVLSKHRRNRLPSIADSVDFDDCKASAFDLNTGSQLSLCSSLESVLLNEIDNSTASLHLGFNHDELKAQLLKRCAQTEVLPFDEIYSASVLKKCRKIGEGVFGEVFLNESRSSYVLKVIPIEGADEINGAQQKRFDEILQEVIISQELSALRHSDENRSAGFVEVLNVRLVEGRYPPHLLDLWDDYDTKQVSENDRPDVFGDDQLYVVFELADCGLDLEAHVFKNAEQSFSAFIQVAISLAAAESQFEFEHRDLHWGNVLVAPTAETSLTFLVNGKSIEIRTHGIKATIIDYTLSRLVYKDCCLFQDLAADPELFEAAGDYQYDIYRLMRTQTNNYWEVFEPYTNVLWLHYTVDKMIDGVNYTAKKGVKHRQFLDKMYKLRDDLQDYRSATEYIEANY